MTLVVRLVVAVTRPGYVLWVLDLTRERGLTVVSETPNQASAGYEPPALAAVGTLHKLTLQGCDKRLNGSDGFTFMGQPIVCRSA
jgi:hypothetical protein